MFENLKLYYFIFKIKKTEHKELQNKEMWWLIGSAPDFCDRFESGFSHNKPDALRIIV